LTTPPAPPRRAGGAGQPPPPPPSPPGRKATLHSSEPFAAMTPDCGAHTNMLLPSPPAAVAGPPKVKGTAKGQGLDSCSLRSLQPHAGSSRWSLPVRVLPWPSACRLVG
jgi:hypothetical protein